MFPTSYILKSQLYDEKFENVFFRCLRNIRIYNKENFVFKAGKVKTIIPLKEIFYFEINKKVITVNCSNNKKEWFYSNLNLVEKDLDDKQFLRIHRSYLVNLNNIYKFSNATITLTTGVILPIGRTYIKAVLRKLNQIYNKI